MVAPVGGGTGLPAWISSRENSPNDSSAQAAARTPPPAGRPDSYSRDLFYGWHVRQKGSEEVVTPAIGCTPMAQEITFLLISARMKPPTAWTKRGFTTQQCCCVPEHIETLSHTSASPRRRNIAEPAARPLKAMGSKKRAVKAKCANMQKAREVVA
ncbi:hypothetical protein HaLaN_09507, partial [Haematococcus lacustris]